jgi:hypothetical protein
VSWRWRPIFGRSCGAVLARELRPAGTAAARNIVVPGLNCCIT